MKRTLSVCFFLLLILGIAWAQDPGWPRQITANGATLLYYQPQIDNWSNFRQLDARMAISLTPAGGQPVLGVMSFRAQTDVNMDAHTVGLTNFQLTNSHFPSLDAASSQQMNQLLHTFVPPGFTQTISLSRLVASVNKPKTPPHAARLNDSPPPIFVSYGPAILLTVYGKPIKAPINKTKVESVINANFPLFFEKSQARYYLFTGKGWLTAGNLPGSWVAANKLPKEFSQVAENPQYEDLKKFIPPPAGAPPGPRVYYSDKPAELLAFSGPAVYSPISGTQLLYASNSDSTLFVYSPTSTYYYLTSGRWFSAPSLAGPWTYASLALPSDFASIPRNSPVADVLASVPGTPEAEDAVLLAQVPTTVVVNPTEAVAKVKISYYGEPKFAPIEGTELQYAVNTPNRVVRVGDLYYLCFQGVWFISKTPQGPWQTAESVPPQIYTIPPSSPVYNVTYVTQQSSSSGNVEASYTAGYLGAFVVGTAFGAIIANGTGYYYPPYVAWGWAPYPVFYPYPYTYGASSWYNPYTGRYGVGGAAYGPYGGARWGASYNPYTGTYARGATAYGPYGGRTVAQAYNPYTGAYGATRQGSNAYSNWGSSVISKGGQTAYTQHYSNARGTVASVETSAGGRAIGGTGKYNSGFAGKTGSGDLYAGHDGNLYRNTGGGWQKYDNGNWNDVTKPASRTQAQKAGSFQQGAAGRGATLQQPQTGANVQSLNQEFQNRQRGAAESQRFQNFQQSSTPSRGWSGASGRTMGGQRSFPAFRGGGFRR